MLSPCDVIHPPPCEGLWFEMSQCGMNIGSNMGPTWAHVMPTWAHVSPYGTHMGRHGTDMGPYGPDMGPYGTHVMYSPSPVKAYGLR